MCTDSLASHGIDCKFAASVLSISVMSQLNVGSARKIFVKDAMKAITRKNV